jgi:branched-chain amino acid transport system permease protein
MGLRAGIRLLYRYDVHQARRAVGEALVTLRHLLPWTGGAALIALPFVYRDPYHLHILILILIWSFAYTSWSMMGRFNLVSLGHGGFMGVGAYVTALLWNHLGVSPWLGIPVAMAAAAVLAVIVAYPCFRFRITGHYFVLVTLALSGIVLQYRDARLYRRFAWIHARPDQGQSSRGAAIRRQDHLVSDRTRHLGAWAGDLALGRRQHGSLCSGGDLRR